METDPTTTLNCVDIDCQRMRRPCWPTHAFAFLVTCLLLSVRRADSYASLSDAATKRGADSIQASLEWIKNQEKKLLSHGFNFTAYELPHMPIFTPDHHDYGGNFDLLRARAGVLQATIREKQLQLQQIEQQAICAEQGPQNLHETSLELPIRMIRWYAMKFAKSANVLGRKLARVQRQIGHNKEYRGVGHYMAHQALSGVHMLTGFVMNPDRVLQMLDPYTPTLVPHAPGIFARADILERHMEPILEKVFNNRRNMACIEPYLDEVFERFDDIEPQLPWLLDNIDVLAPYTGLMMKHFDELLLYSHTNKECLELSNRMLPYADRYLSNLDILGPHLTLLRPHVRSLLKHNRIDKMLPHIDKLFAHGYVDLNTSANMDVILFWVGWTLNIPGFASVLFSIPRTVKVMNFLGKYLPKRFVRKYESRNIRVNVEGNYGEMWNHVTKEEPSVYSLGITSRVK